MTGFVLKIKGRKIWDHRVPIGVLGKYLNELQGAFFDIARIAKRMPAEPSKRKAYLESLEFYVGGIGPGSVDVKVVPSMMPLPGVKPVWEPIVSIFLDGLEIIQASNEQAGFDRLKEKFGSYYDRIHLLNRYLAIWSIPGVEAEFVLDGFIPGKKDIYEVTPSFEPRIRKWLKEELAHIEETRTGIITRLKADGIDRYFVLKDDNGHIIECKYTPEQESEILALFKNPVSLKGIVRQLKNKTVVKELLEVERLDSITFSQADYPALKEEIECLLEYDPVNEVYIAKREDLDLRIVSSTKEGLKKEIATILDFMVDSCLIQGEEIEPPEVVEALKQIIDLSKRPNEKWEAFS